jgi:[acyl-carrier-protein] S-malonyltransferase
MKAIIFPGQGAEYPGMGKDLYDNFPQARGMFSHIDDLLGLKISQICFEGTKEELRGMYIQQLAVLATSLVAYELFKEKNIDIDFLSGLSFGEHICLYPAGVLDLKDLVYLIKGRAEATERASKLCLASMLAVIGLEREYLEEKSKKEDFYLANINSPRQMVVSLKKEDKEKVTGALKDSGAKVIELQISGGFHSPFMEEAKQQFKEVADKVEFKHARIPILSNVTARAHTKGEEIKKNLIEQLTTSAFWQDCVEFMIKNGVDVFFEIGPSQISRHLIKKVNPKVKVINIEKKEDLTSDSLLWGENRKPKGALSTSILS